MSELFNLQNWNDLTREDSFWAVALGIAGGLMIIMLVLFADRLKHFHLEHAERAKWLQWNKSKS